jgi:Uri superfamily endonuclease
LILDQALYFYMIRPQPGTYALIFSARRKYRAEIGKLGSLELKPGFYIYVGSAFGPGGLKARIDHHRKKADHPHWHMDYLGPFFKLIEIWYTYDPVQREHLWAKIISNTRGASVPLDGFGSSDCRCRAHLFFRTTKPSIRTFRQKIFTRIDNHGKEKILWQKAQTL